MCKDDRVLFQRLDLNASKFKIIQFILVYFFAKNI